MHRVNFVDGAALVVYNHLAPLIVLYLAALIKLSVSWILGLLGWQHSLMWINDGVFSRYSLKAAWIKDVRKS